MGLVGLIDTCGIALLIVPIYILKLMMKIVAMTATRMMVSCLSLLHVSTNPPFFYKSSLLLAVGGRSYSSVRSLGVSVGCRCGIGIVTK